MYKVNDIVVYRRDVCKIIGKHRSDFTGEMCYEMVPYMVQDGSIKMLVPVSNRGGHLRDLITKEEVDALIKEAAGIKALANKPANMKSQYANLLKGDDINDLICIIKTSYGRNKARMEQHKKLASIDDEYLQKAEKYLYDEISVALGMDYEEAKEYFEKAVDKEVKKQKAAKKRQAAAKKKAAEKAKASKPKTTKKDSKKTKKDTKKDTKKTKKTTTKKDTKKDTKKKTTKTKAKKKK